MIISQIRQVVSVVASWQTSDEGGAEALEFDVSNGGYLGVYLLHRAVRRQFKNVWTYSAGSVS